MLHTEVGCFHQFESILIKGVRSQILLVTSHHRFYLQELFFCFFKIVGKDEIIQSELSAQTGKFIGEMSIVRNIQSDIISIDWIEHLPVKLGFFSQINS